jgi:hypothetical protein
MNRSCIIVIVANTFTISISILFNRYNNDHENPGNFRIALIVVIILKSSHVSRPND